MNRTIINIFFTAFLVVVLGGGGWWLWNNKELPTASTPSNATNQETSTTDTNTMPSQTTTGSEQIQINVPVITQNTTNTIKESAQDCVKNKIGKLGNNSAGTTTITQDQQQEIIAECTKEIMASPGLSTALQGITGGTSSLSGMPSSSLEIPSEPNDFICSLFKSAPSCDYVPENVRSLCEKCK